MKKIKHVTAVLLLIVFFVSTASIFAMPASADTHEYYKYTVSDGKATITNVYTSISGNITIPDTLGGYPVTSIGDGAFEDCTSLASVTIGNRVETIGSKAFDNCENLKSITIPDSVTSIGSHVFGDCTRLESVYITDIAAWCNINFNNNASSNPLYYTHKLYLNGTLVTDLVIPDSVTSISDYAFYDCESLTSITIPDRATLPSLHPQNNHCYL